MLNSDIMDLGSSRSLSSDTDSELSGTSLSGSPLGIDLAIFRNTGEIEITARDSGSSTSIVEIFSGTAPSYNEEFTFLIRLEVCERSLVVLWYWV
jgi:hypothetical protein